MKLVLKRSNLQSLRMKSDNQKLGGELHEQRLKIISKLKFQVYSIRILKL